MAAISDASVFINNIPVMIMPNSFEYDEGQGEDEMRVESAGGGNVGVVYSRNVQTALSSFKFKMLNTAVNIALARGWKVNADGNAVTVVDNASGFTRSFANAALINNYKVALGADGALDLEWKSKAAV